MNKILITLFIIFGWQTIDYRITEYHSYCKYNNMSGIVIDNFVSQGRYLSTAMPTIRLSDGTTEVVNGGYSTYNIGDAFINHMNFNWVFGITGTAYSINPEENVVRVILSIFFEMGFIIFIIGLILRRYMWHLLIKIVF